MIGRVTSIRAAVRRAALAGALVAALAPATGAQQAPAVPDFKVEVWGTALVEFTARMATYAELRETLQQGIPRLAVTADPAEIRKAEAALAIRIREARAGARRGAIFSRAIRRAFRRALKIETDPGRCEAIRDDNPGDFDYRINGTYPKYHPLSTVPPTILSTLPELPPDVYYRFLGRDLVLHDTRANVILDEIDNAITCPRR